MRISLKSIVISLSLVVALLGLISTASAATYDSCIDALKNGETNSGTYTISSLGNVYCDMETFGGGWLGVTPEMARDEFNGTLEIVDGDSGTDSGFDSSDRPYTQDDTGGHTAHYTFRLPSTIKEFFFKDYTAKSNSAVDDSSDIYPSRFVQSDWDSAHEQSVGDISFGFANDNGPITSFADELNSDTLFGNGQIVSWPDDGRVYSSSNGDNDFRIGWGDEGSPREGWFPWWGGMIMVRDGDGFISVKIDDIDIETDQDVDIDAIITGFGDDSDAKIKVEYERDEGGDCNGTWRDAALKSNISATHDDSDGEPSIDNNDTYQIGSDSRRRVVTSEGQNKIAFTWDAREDLGNSIVGDYCIRLTVRNDDGEEDTDTEIIRFRGAGDDIKIEVRDATIEPDDDVDFTVRVSGDPTDEDSKVRVEYERDEGGSCNGSWVKADIKSGATATNDDSNGNPSVDNGDSYQIGSDSRERVITDGSNNTLEFKWDASNDLGTNVNGTYCVRVTVRSDSGESDTDVYKVRFDGSIDPDTPNNNGGVIITSPLNNVTINTNSPAIIGNGVPGNRIVVAAVGHTCTATVLSSGGWTCTLANLQPGIYSVVASQYTPIGLPNGTAIGGFTIGASTPTGTGLCAQHITSYMKLGQYNDQVQVRKLQEYLNTREGERLAVSGVFDILTEQAVKRYQVKYAQEILYPWGMQAPSGFVYKTTINHINRQLCSGSIQCPVFTQYHRVGDSGGEVAKIQNFLRGYGYYNGSVSGYFDAATDAGIKAFQEEFRPMVLTPWNLPSPTGYWYKTSRKHANWLQGCYERVTLEGVGITF